MLTILQRAAACALALGLVLAPACGGDDDGGGDAAPTPPAGVPAGATPIAGDVTIGSLEADSSEARRFVSTACADDVLAIVTDRESLFARLPCDRALPASVTQEWAGQRLRIRVAETGQPNLFISLESGASAEFTVDRAWVVPGD